MAKEIRKHVERRVKLNDTYIKSLRTRDKLYSIGDSEMVGLRLYVHVPGSKLFYFSYKPLNEKNWVRYKIGSFNILNVKQTRDKAKLYASGIIEGKDPVQVKRELKAELTLKELIEVFYQKRLNRSFWYKPTTIKTIKVYFKVWVFQKTSDLKVRKVLEENPFGLQHKKLSTINKEDIRKLHTIIGIKSPGVADKTIDYLKVLFNFALEEGLTSKIPFN